MKLVFFGTPAVAVPTLEALVRSGHELCRVVTQPDRPVGRSRRPQAPAVKRAALGHGLTVDQPARVRGREFREALSAVEPDAFVVVAYGRILPGRLLQLPSLGPVNVHFSLLPAYRGAAPVQWALARGETTTGVTTMLMNERLDEGDLLLQQPVEIQPDEHAPALQARLAVVGAALLVETLSRLETGAITPRPQDPAAASYAPLLRPEDGRAALDRPARAVEGQVRGFDPWPGAWVVRDRRRLRLVDVASAEGRPDDAEPGRVLELVGQGLAVACAASTRLVIRSLQPEGRRVMDARDAVNGRLVLPDDRLTW